MQKSILKKYYKSLNYGKYRPDLPRKKKKKAKKKALVWCEKVFHTIWNVEGNKITAKII